MARRRHLTDTQVAALKPAPDGQRYDFADPEVPGLFIRVGSNGRKSFILYTRYPGSRAPSRRSLGRYGALTLAKAREKARGWLELIGRGIDPKVEEDRQQAAQHRRRKNTLAAVAEDFIADKLSGERKGKEVERDIRRDLMPSWGSLPITDVSDDEVVALVKAKARNAPAQARNMLGTIKRLFQWAIDQRAYGLKSSPAATLKPKAIVGNKKRRNRTLSEDELFALWRAAKRMPYPQGPAYRLLALTALRLNEVVDAALPEFHADVARVLRNGKSDIAEVLRRLPVDRKMWIIPEERMKGRNDEARPHAVPLTDDALTVIASLPRFKSGTFLFSTTFGESPVWIGDKVKKDIDARMLRTLKALAKVREDDPKSVELKPWVNHDIRRTVRSHLSRLKVSEEAREAVMAHARPGIKGTYDLHDYLDEKREALELWAARLRGIVEPPPSNVVALRA